MPEAGLPQPRVDYVMGTLDDGTLDPEDPLRHVREWLHAAIDAGVDEAISACLATVDVDGVPDARMVLVRGVDGRGVSWYSNRRSAKGRQLAVHPVAAIVLHWPELQRQVRVRGRVEHLPDDESDAYFASRPRAAQLGAWASDQSEPIASRAALDARLVEVEARFAGVDAIPRPPHWGGELLRPDAVELWQGRPARLHDRFLYTRDGDGWWFRRLMP